MLSILKDSFKLQKLWSKGFRVDVLNYFLKSTIETFLRKVIKHMTNSCKDKASD